MVSVQRRLFVFFLLFAFLAVGLSSGAPAGAVPPFYPRYLTPKDHEMIGLLRTQQSNLMSNAGHPFQMRIVNYHAIPNLFDKMLDTAKTNGVRWVGRHNNDNYFMTAVGPDSQLGREMRLASSGTSHDIASMLWKVDPQGWSIVNIDTVTNPGLDWRSQLRPFERFFRPA